MGRLVVVPHSAELAPSAPSPIASPRVPLGFRPAAGAGGGQPGARSPRSARAALPRATTDVEVDHFALPAESTCDEHPSSLLARLRLRVSPEDQREQPAQPHDGADDDAEDEEQQHDAVGERGLAGELEQQQLAETHAFRYRPPSARRLMAAEEATAARAAAISEGSHYAVPVTGVSAPSVYRVRLSQIEPGRQHPSPGSVRPTAIALRHPLTAEEVRFNGWSRAVMGRRLRACIPGLALTCDEVGLSRLLEAAHFVSYMRYQTVLQEGAPCSFVSARLDGDLATRALNGSGESDAAMLGREAVLCHSAETESDPCPRLTGGSTQHGCLLVHLPAQHLPLGLCRRLKRSLFADLLRTLPLLRDLPEQAIRLLADEVELRAPRRGERLLRDADGANSFALLYRGALLVTHEGAAPRRRAPAGSARQSTTTPSSAALAAATAAAAGTVSPGGGLLLQPSERQQQQQPSPRVARFESGRSSEQGAGTGAAAVAWEALAFATTPAPSRPASRPATSATSRPATSSALRPAPPGSAAGLGPAPGPVVKRTVVAGEPGAHVGESAVLIASQRLRSLAMGQGRPLTPSPSTPGAAREQVFALCQCVVLVLPERAIDAVILGIVPDLAERLEKEAAAVQAALDAKNKARADLELLTSMAKRAASRDPYALPGGAATPRGRGWARHLPLAAGKPRVSALQSIVSGAVRAQNEP